MSEAQTTNSLFGISTERLSSVIVAMGMIAAVALIGMLSVAGWTVASIGEDLREIELPASSSQPAEPARHAGMNVDL